MRFNQIDNGASSPLEPRHCQAATFHPLAGGFVGVRAYHRHVTCKVQDKIHC